MSDVILWVEDNPEDNLLEFIVLTIKKTGCEPVSVKGVSQLANELNTLREEKKKIRGIILDMMLYGCDDLSAFDYSEVQISRATSINMGELLLKYVFRNTMKDDKDIWWDNLTKDVPVLILSVRPDLNPYQFKDYGEKIDIIHKYEYERDSWKDDVINWIKRL